MHPSGSSYTQIIRTSRGRDIGTVCAHREPSSNARMKGETSESRTPASNSDHPSTLAYLSSRSSSLSRNAEDAETRDKLLHPLHRRPSRKRGTFEKKNIMVEGCTVLLTHLPRLSTKVQAQVYDLLCGLGFSDQMFVSFRL